MPQRLMCVFFFFEKGGQPSTTRSPRGMLTRDGECTRTQTCVEKMLDLERR